MDVESIVGALGLNATRIVAKASATEDYARILIERAAEDPAAAEAWRVRASSAQTIAGSLWMLVRPQEAFAPLGHAEEIHDAIGSAYGSLLSICAHPRRPTPAQPLPRDVWAGPQAKRPDDPERERSPEPDQALARLQPAASLLAHLWPLAAGQTDQSLKQLLSDTPVLQTLPGSWLTGRLRIPLAHYRGLATEIDQLRHGERTVGAQRRDPLPAARAFLERAGEAIGAARENEHQWRTLRSPILPAEPEVMAACALVELTARDALGVSAIEAMGVPAYSLAGALMGVAQNLLDADAGATPEAAR
jgi:hypothetical protein